MAPWTLVNPVQLITQAGRASEGIDHELDHQLDRRRYDDTKLREGSTA
jgi:hypothetical protein